MRTGKKEWNDFTYLLVNAWQHKRRLYLYFVLNILLSFILSIAAILTPRFLIEELTGQAEADMIIKIALVYFLVTAAAGVSLSFVKAGYEFDVARFRYYFIEKIMRVRYENLESPKYLNEFWRGNSAVSDVEQEWGGKDNNHQAAVTLFQAHWRADSDKWHRHL